MVPSPYCQSNSLGGPCGAGHCSLVVGGRVLAHTSLLSGTMAEGTPSLCHNYLLFLSLGHGLDFDHDLTGWGLVVVS